MIDNTNYVAPTHVAPSDAARKNNNEFHIYDVAYFSRPYAATPNMDRGEMWMTTNYTYEGHPVYMWLDIGKDGVQASEAYIDMRNADPKLLEDASWLSPTYGASYFPNLEDYTTKKFGSPQSVPLTNESGETLMSAELQGLAREHGMREINKPHVRAFDEYKEWRDLNEFKMGPYEEGDYWKYLDSVLDDMANNRTDYIGKANSFESVKYLYDQSPEASHPEPEDFDREYDE